MQIQETRTHDRITNYISESHEGPYIHRTEPCSYLDQLPIIYDYKTIMNKYLSVQSTNMNFGGQPNL